MAVCPRSAPRFTYVTTARYSKEERASLELGDTVYPYDSGVEVLLPDIPGVVVLKSSLPPAFLGELLSRHHLPTVEYVTHVLYCVNCYGIGGAVEQLVREVVSSGACFGRVRIPRAGSVGKRFLGRAGAELRRYAREGCGTLSLEAFGFLVCFGPVVYPLRQFRTPSAEIAAKRSEKRVSEAELPDSARS